MSDGSKNHRRVKLPDATFKRLNKLDQQITAELFELGEIDFMLHSLKQNRERVISDLSDNKEDYNKLMTDLSTKYGERFSVDYSTGEVILPD